MVQECVRILAAVLQQFVMGFSRPNLPSFLWHMKNRLFCFLSLFTIIFITRDCVACLLVWHLDPPGSWPWQVNQTMPIRALLLPLVVYYCTQNVARVMETVEIFLICFLFHCGGPEDFPIASFLENNKLWNPFGHKGIQNCMRKCLHVPKKLNCFSKKFAILMNQAKKSNCVKSAVFFF